IGAQWTLGERLKSWSVGYTDPWISGSDYSLHLKAFTSSSDRDLYRSRDPEARGRYDLERIGGHVGIGQPVGGNFRLVLKYSFEDVQVGGFQEPTVPTGGGLYAQEVGAAVGRKQVSSFGLDLYRRSIGRAWGSTPGTDASLQASFSPKYLGSTANFLRLRTEIYRHISILPGQILSVGGRAGTVLGSPPFYERLYLDGPNQLRGLERRKLGPEGGAQFASAELLYSISLGGLGRLYSFVEGAGVRRPIDGTVRRDSDWTAGVGILLFNRVDISLGISTGTLIVKSHRFGGINVDL
ncbi:MAG: BamA/TamA family outer membrane protein, partial [Candidatus Latescibacteria bacterium]|nr:BamA/TamA family outer membrane protein [Candidatus Latescibacterota bacterium]